MLDPVTPVMPAVAAPDPDVAGALTVVGTLGRDTVGAGAATDPLGTEIAGAAMVGAGADALAGEAGDPEPVGPETLGVAAAAAGPPADGCDALDELSDVLPVGAKPVVVASGRAGACALASPPAALTAVRT